MEMPTPTLIKARGGVGVAVWLCFLTLGAGGAWAVVAATNPSRLGPPPVPTLGTVPPSSTEHVYAVFSFVDRQRRIYFQCSLDGEPFRGCSSPVRYGPVTFTVRARCKGHSKEATGRPRKWCVYTTISRRSALAPGSHVFKVRAIARKMVGAPGSYTWTILSPGAAHSFAPASSPPSPTPALAGGGEALAAPQLNFTISGAPEGLLYPGGAPRRIPLALRNPNTVGIYVTGLTVSAASENPDCPVEENLRITQSNASAPTPIVIPQGGSVTLPTQGITAPSIQLIDLQSVNQDGCKGSTFVLRYSGSAHA